MTEPRPRQYTNCKGGDDTEWAIVDIEQVIAALTPERLTKYFQRMGPNNQAALALYCWNHEVGAAFNVTLQQFEICLRNSISKALRDKFGERWFENLKFQGISAEIRSIVGKTSEKAKENKRGFPPSTHDFIAATSMGLWREVCRPAHAGFWAKRLRLAFPHAPVERDVRKTLEAIHNRVHRLVRLRNRIAHHEPLIGSRVEPIGEMLVQRHADMTELLAWMDPNFLTWLGERDRLRETVASCPFMQATQSSSGQATFRVLEVNHQ
jgi:hypothetical protein